MQIGAFHIIMSSFRAIVGSFRLIMGSFCITSAFHIITSVLNIPSGQFYIIACANYTIISGKRNIMGRRVPRNTCLRGNQTTIISLDWLNRKRI